MNVVDIILVRKVSANTYKHPDVARLFRPQFAGTQRRPAM